MKIPVYRLMSAAQNRMLESALKSLQPVLGVEWEFPEGEGSDGLTYVCGLPASRLLDTHTVVGAPVLRARRYADRPVYFTDVLVHGDNGKPWWESPTVKVWAYNDRDSFSGWVAVLDGLRRRGLDRERFRWVPTASHANSLTLLATGQADLTGVDSMIWDHANLSGQAVDRQVRAVDSFGPWPMPPLIASRRLGVEFLTELREVLPLAANNDELGHDEIQLVARWAVVDDSHLNPIVDAVRSLGERVPTR